MFGPVGRRKTERIHAGFGAVPELVDAANEAPTIGLDALVGVLVQHRLVDPTPVDFDLGLRIDPAGGVIGVDQIDHVRADVEDAPPDATELGIETRPERITTREITTDPDVGDEQADERVQVSRADGERVPSGELTDVFVQRAASRPTSSIGGSYDR